MSRKVLISLSQYLQFWKALRKQLGPQTKLLAVVKANAYGLGALPLAQILNTHKAVDYLGVATLEEGKQLRNASINLPILLFSQPHDPAPLLELSIEPAVYTDCFIRQLGQLTTLEKKQLGVHLKINTGMNRLGCRPDKASELVSLIQSHPYLTLKSVWTHLASADDVQNPQTLQQLHLFQSTIKTLSLTQNTWIHAANSDAYRHFQESHLGMVRIGIDSLKHIATLKSKVQGINWVEIGEKISYGGSAHITEKTQIATLEIGYADGIPRQFKGDVLIQGKRYPVIGKVCMDLLMVDIGQDYIPLGAEAVFVGTQAHKTISIEEFSHNSHRITYEALCALGPRVERIYED